jgi:hypothetical protein
MEEKLQKLVQASHEIIDANDKSVAMIVMVKHQHSICHVCGDCNTVANLLYNAAKKNEGLADIMAAVANAIKEGEEDEQ